MSDFVHLELLPLGKVLRVKRGTPLHDVLFAHGVEFPCGGRGLCKGCRVKVLAGVLPITDEDQQKLSGAELAEGWRLACQMLLSGPCALFVPTGTVPGGQVFQIDGEVDRWQAQPAVEAVSLSLALPTLSDLSSDLQRVETALEHALPGRHPSITLPVLATLSPALRTGDGPIWVVLRGNQIVSVRRGPRPQLLGLAVDVGTTKLAFYLVDLESGKTVAAKGSANPQIAEGEDVMSRLEAVLSRGRGASLQGHIMAELNAASAEMCAAHGRTPPDIVEYCVVGNTAMHHLFLGLPVGQLAVSPFVPSVSRAIDVSAAEMDLAGAPGAIVHMPAIIAGFVGSDHLAFLLSSGFGLDDSTRLGIDIGTNTEIALQAGGRIRSCSTASGPAFEGAEIRQGMRAEPGAIDRVSIDANGVVGFSVIGGGEAQGLCGSGILDALSEMRRAGIVNQRGRLLPGKPGVLRSKDGAPAFLIAPSAGGSGMVTLGQDDIDHILLAKGAIRAGIEILLETLGTSAMDIAAVVIAGAFGCSLDPLRAMRIGMFPDLPKERILFAGNAAGKGARMMLASTEERSRAALLAKRVEYVELAVYPGFHSHFARGIRMPD